MNRIIIVLLLSLVISPANIFSQEWTQTGSIPQGAGVTDMVVLENGTLIATTASYNWPSGQQGGIRRSTDEGNTWQNVMNAYNGRTLYAGPSGKIFASCWLYPANEGVFFSTDGGLNWQQTFFGAANDNVFSIAAKNGDSMVFIGTRNGVYRNFNNGSWIQLMTGMPVNSWVRDISISSDGTILAATTNGVYRSTNHGNQWTPSGNGISSSDTIISISRFTENGLVYCASSSGKAYKANSGSFNWEQVFTQRYEKISKIDVSPELLSNIFMIIIANLSEEAIDHINYSVDQGFFWRGTSLGISGHVPVSVFAFKFLFGSVVRVYAALFLNSQNGGKVFWADFDGKVGVNQISSQIPGSYSLKQNYPNPFNPVTNLEFGISESGFVSLKIYNMLGKEVATLVSTNLSPGTYEYKFDASDLNSGMYFYKLVTEGFTETKKMMLTK